MRYAMIMAGGAGVRLWPMSREDRPKQLLRFIEEPGREARSLLEIAAERLGSLVEPSRCYVCTAERYRDAIRRDVPLFGGREGDERILGEPCARDTVNAVGLTAAILESIDRDAVFAVMTADHIIEPVDLFRRRVELGFRLVEQDPRRLVTFSIRPTYPATGFGYVERGAPIRGVTGAEEPDASGVQRNLAFFVERFVEKPDLPRAQAYVQSGQFAWNSGMFVWRASTVMDALRRYQPANAAGLTAIAKAWRTPARNAVLAETYASLPKTSIDFGVMEFAAKDPERPFPICTVLMDVRWLDVGSWPSYAETLTADDAGNRRAGAGDVIVNGGRNNLIVSGEAGHTVALMGLDDVVVVHTQDATLVMPRARAEEIKSLHARLGAGLK